MDKALYDRVLSRYRAKFNHAKGAYIRESTSKCADNCKHGGRRLTDELRVCNLFCQGKNEAQAQTCWKEKAQQCISFTPRKTADELADEFSEIPLDQLHLRWPSLGELSWVLRQIKP